MKIKEVKSQDLDNIFALEQEIFGQNAFSKDLIKKLIRRNTFFLKLEDNEIGNEIIGFIIIIKDQDHKANIINFLINPKYQSKGYGEYLFLKSLKKIKKLNDVNTIILNVQISNFKAINLYQKFGFSILQKIDNYYQTKESSYLMELKL